MNRTPKIKIPKQDLQHFLAENLTFDPFWQDLIDKGDKKRNR